MSHGHASRVTVRWLQFTGAGREALAAPARARPLLVRARHVRELVASLLRQRGHNRRALPRRCPRSRGEGALPGRENIVVTRRRDYAPRGVVVAHSVAEAVERATMSGEIFVIGGEQIYRALLPRVSTLYLTRVHAVFAGADVRFPEVNAAEWACVAEEWHRADERNPYDYTFVTLARRRR